MVYWVWGRVISYLNFIIISNTCVSSRYNCFYYNDSFFFQGYLFISVLVNTNSDLIKLINQSIKNDLQSRYVYVY